MRNWKEITDKIIELLTNQNTDLPDFDVTTDTGRSRLILYFNKHRTEETQKELLDFLSN